MHRFHHIDQRMLSKALWNYLSTFIKSIVAKGDVASKLMAHILEPRKETDTIAYGGVYYYCRGMQRARHYTSVLDLPIVG